MKLSLILTALFTLSSAEVFPLNKQLKPPVVYPYSIGDELQLECIQREIDNGEHKFDDDKNIIYGPFPTCVETGKPFSLKYGVNEDTNCTIQLDDELYHLFQLYIHEDAPFSCRIPYSKTYKDGYIPLTLNFRGHLESSHLDIDSTMNVVAHKKNDGTVITAIGYSSGDQTNRYIIGDKMPLQFSVNWIDEYHKGETWHYKLSTGFSASFVYITVLISVVIGGIIVYAGMYARFNRKLVNLGYKYATEEDKRD